MVVLGKEILRECPNSFITEWSTDMVDLFFMCHTVLPAQGGPVILAGSPPSHGGILDQDNATMEAFRVIRSELAAMKPKKK